MRIRSKFIPHANDRKNFLLGIEQLEYKCVQYIGSVYTFVGNSEESAFRVVKHPRSEKQSFTLLVDDNRSDYTDIIKYFNEC